ncbi:DNA adenine methylase [Leucobacter albus]|uniref:site-specific DNA-methyltransferase (adenine-specific) n=1 Tax=Leucobacter albus TaxID=272210 RepID=A0ABW3TRT3_9MICO
MNKAENGFRPVHYLGNKSRFLEPIVDSVVGLAPEKSTVVDLFAGSGVVTRGLAAHRRVISADIQRYSSILTEALCNPTVYSVSSQKQLLSAAHDWMERLPASALELIRFEDEVSHKSKQHPERFVRMMEEATLSSAVASDAGFASLKEEAERALRPFGAVIGRHYGGAYFSYRQALEIDALLHTIEHSAGNPANSTLVAAILGTASDLASTVGNHFAQPNRLRARDGSIKIKSMESVLRHRETSALPTFKSWLQRYSTLPPTKNSCEARTSDFRLVLDSLADSVGVVYADPPYTRDHYSRFYHVLETIALADEPGVTRAPGSSLPSRGLYRIERHQSPFSIRSKAELAFKTMFAKLDESTIPLVLSYSPQGGGTLSRPETRLLTIDRLVEMASDHFRRVETVQIPDSTHSRLNRVEYHGSSPKDAEVLIIASH